MEYIHEAQAAPSVRPRSEFFLIGRRSNADMLCIEAPDLVASTFKLSTTTSQTQTQLARFWAFALAAHIQTNSNANNTNSVRMRGASTSTVSTLIGSHIRLYEHEYRHRRNARAAAYTEWALGSAFFNIWRIPGTSAYLRRPCKSRTRVHRALHHEECEIAC